MIPSWTSPACLRVLSSIGRYCTRANSYNSGAEKYRRRDDQEFDRQCRIATLPGHKPHDKKTR